MRGGDLLPVNKLFGRKGLLTRQHFHWQAAVWKMFSDAASPWKAFVFMC